MCLTSAKGKLKQVPTSRQAFTIVELLVVIGIIGVLIGLTLGGVLKVVEAANRLRCASNLRQIGLALTQYHEALGSFPNNGGWDGQ